ncbi:dephospho-CoA kinase [Arundinibacter roseus]|uniref:Dephospho-CoA kinase n=1 Tax=Arundinibacter roseus TaxID=2070510 RepID=A0A4R4KF71_9BACT|nr:dephospho-CoA kinase [Arundinibacter roseus]TDB65109.1 dephospho-CoA kinase [Arundinibacter roseus]
MRKAPLEIGVTGGIGSGKSIVCRIFSCLNVPIYDADKRAKWLTVNDLDLKSQIVTLLGESAYDSDGTYNRTYVAQRVFKDSALLTQLNQLIHPKVHEDAADWLKSKLHVPYVIREAALMKKAGDQNTLDFTVLVTAPLDLRISRTLARDPHRTAEDIRAIMQNQLSDEERQKFADFVIDNSADSPLIPQVLTLHNHFLEKAAH